MRGQNMRALAAMVILATAPVASPAQQSTVAGTSTRSPRPAAQPREYHHGVDVLNYDVSIALPDTGRVIEGRAVLTILMTAKVDTLVLDLLHLRIDTVLVEDRLV